MCDGTEEVVGDGGESTCEVEILLRRTRGTANDEAGSAEEEEEAVAAIQRTLAHAITREGMMESSVTADQSRDGKGKEDIK